MTWAPRAARPSLWPRTVAQGASNGRTPPERSLMLLHPKGPEVTPSFGGGHTCLFCRLSSVPLPHFGLVTPSPFAALLWLVPSPAASGPSWSRHVPSWCTPIFSGSAMEIDAGCPGCRAGAWTASLEAPCSLLGPGRSASR